MIKQLSTIVSMIFLCGVGVSIQAAKLDFIDAKFDDFMARVQVPPAERDNFKGYYAQLFTLLKDSEETKKRAAQGYLYKQALAGLEKKHEDWYAALKPFISDPRITLDTELNDVRVFISGFLIRYGAYEEYCTKKAATRSAKIDDQTGIWDTVKLYADGARATVASWCYSIKTQLVG